MPARLDWTMEPGPCTEDGCDCTTWRWNGISRVLRIDPPSGCTCGHLTAKHAHVKVPR